MLNDPTPVDNITHTPCEPNLHNAAILETSPIKFRHLMFERQTLPFTADLLFGRGHPWLLCAA